LVDEASYRRRWLALALLSLSLTLIIIDSTIVNIAFPAIQETFGASFAEAEWVNSIYSLVFGAALITWGKLGDQFGRRRIFVWGAIVFVAGSAGTGLAQSIGMVIAFRAVQGLGGAMMSPSTLSILSSTFRGRERGMAFGLWGATAGVAAALGPIVGGWLITHGTGIVHDSWRLAFLVNLPLGLIAVAGSYWAIRESRAYARRHEMDVPGIVLASLGVGAIVFGAIEGQTYGWLAAKKVFSLGPITYPPIAAGAAIPAGTRSFIPFAFALGLVLLVVFYFVEATKERRGGEPLFEFGLLRYRSFAYGLLTVGIVALGEFGVMLVLSIFFQLGKGVDAFGTGVRFLPFAATTLVAAPAAGALSSRFGAKWVVTAGMFCEAAALFWISRVTYEHNPYVVFVPPFILYGIGVGLAIAQLTNIVLSDVPPQKAGVASGANNTVRQMGASLGIAVIGAILFGTFAARAKPLIERSAAFEDFGQRVAANASLPPEAKLFGMQLAAFGPQAKRGIEAGLDNNEGFDTTADVLDMALAQMPPQAKAALKQAQGIDLNDPQTVAKIRAALAPDLAILSKDIQTALGEGFAAAGRRAALMAAAFVALGALSSLMLPNTRRYGGGDPPAGHRDPSAEPGGRARRSSPPPADGATLHA
jgi:MFS family permease